MRQRNRRWTVNSSDLQNAQSTQLASLPLNFNSSLLPERVIE